MADWKMSGYYLCDSTGQSESYGSSAGTYVPRGYVSRGLLMTPTGNYAAGDELTIADLSLYAGYWRTKGAFAECVEGFKNLDRWAAEIGARPGVQRALKF